MHATQHCGDKVNIDSLATHKLISCAVGEKDAYVTTGMHQLAVNDITKCTIPSGTLHGLYIALVGKCPDNVTVTW